jgi:hypothetical protein
MACFRKGAEHDLQNLDSIMSIPVSPDHSMCVTATSQQVKSFDRNIR